MSIPLVSSTPPCVVPSLLLVDQLKMCERCKAIFYCCVAHQKKDWPYHQLVCKAPPEKVDEGKVTSVASVVGVAPSPGPGPAAAPAPKPEQEEGSVRPFGRLKFDDCILQILQSYPEGEPPPFKQRETVMGSMPISMDMERIFAEDRDFYIFMRHLIQSPGNTNKVLYEMCFDKQIHGAQREYAAFALWMRKALPKHKS